MVSEEVHDPNPTRHLQLRLNLHRGSAGATQPTVPVPERGPQRVLDQPDSTIRIVNRERLNCKSGGHELGLTRFDLAGGYEHEPDLGSGVKKLKATVEVAESCPVRVPNADVLGKGEVDGGVLDGEGRELDGADGDFGVFGLEDGEVDYEDDDDDEN